MCVCVCDMYIYIYIYIYVCIIYILVCVCVCVCVCEDQINKEERMNFFLLYEQVNVNANEINGHVCFCRI